MDADQMLEHRYSTLLGWADPWRALDAEVGSFTACVHHYATVHDCIGIARENAVALGRPPSIDDKEALLDFIATMWASPITEGRLARSVTPPACHHE